MHSKERNCTKNRSEFLIGLVGWVCPSELGKDLKKQLTQKRVSVFTKVKKVNRTNSVAYYGFVLFALPKQPLTTLWSR